jgi:hypothetical protein
MRPSATQERIDPRWIPLDWNSVPALPKGVVEIDPALFTTPPHFDLAWRQRGSLFGDRGYFTRLSPIVLWYGDSCCVDWGRLLADHAGSPQRTHHRMTGHTMCHRVFRLGFRFCSAQSEHVLRFPHRLRNACSAAGTSNIAGVRPLRNINAHGTGPACNSVPRVFRLMFHYVLAVFSHSRFIRRT